MNITGQWLKTFVKVQACTSVGCSESRNLKCFIIIICPTNQFSQQSLIARFKNVVGDTPFEVFKQLLTSGRHCFIGHSQCDVLKHQHLSLLRHKTTSRHRKSVDAYPYLEAVRSALLNDK